ncbi:hypothetical protein FJZ33_06325 [Candidatus Poribacteria bacterium]|nr:hypothetical protein [Candidatus Poribacteria bacterium]
MDQYEDYDIGEIQAIDALIKNHPQVTIFVDSVRKPLLDTQKDEANIIVMSDKRQNRFNNSFSKHINRFLGKTVYPEVESDKIQSVPITIAVENTTIDESEYIARTIKKLVEQNGRNYSEFAILCRDNGDFGTILHDSLRHYSIPCPEIPDLHFNPLVIFAELCLKAIADHQNDELILKWLLTAVSRLDRNDVYRAYRYAKENRQEFIRVLTGDDSKLANLLGKSYQRLKELMSIWDFAQNELRGGTQVWEIIKPVLEKAGDINPDEIPVTVSNFINLVQDTVEIYQGRMRLQSILNDIDEATLQQISLNNAIFENQNVVKIMSIWESRGLEFPIVFIPGMAQDFFPARHPARQLLYGEELGHIKAVLRNVNLPGTMSYDQWWEHEKLLLYIGMTRAKEKLFLTLAESYNREIISEPSRLLSELIEGQELSAENCSKYHIAYQYHTISDSIDILPSPDNILSKSEFEIILIRYIREIKELETYKPEGAKSLIARLGISDDILPPAQMVEYPVLFPKDKKLNNTSIRDFLSCPRKYFFQHILKIESDRNMDSIFGSLIHDVLKKFHRLYPNLKDYGEDELKNYISHILTEEWNERFQSKSIPDNLQIKSYWRFANTALLNYLNGEFKIWDKERTCIKTEDEFLFNFCNKYILTGRIDRIDDYMKIGNEIVDFKVSHNNDAESALKSKFLNTEDDPEYKPQDYQLPIYYFASQDKPEIHPVKLVVYQLLTYSKQAKGPFRREIEIIPDKINRSEKGDHFITKADLDSIREDMIITLDRMADGDYPPQPREDQDCKNCGFIFICDK